MADWIRLYRYAEGQHGAVAAWQAAGLGIPASTLHDHASKHGWDRLLRGVWGVSATLDTYERRLAAGRLTTGNHAPLTGESTLWLVGAVRRRPQHVHLWCPPRLHLVAADGIRYHRGAWVLGDRIERRRGFPTAPPLRGLTDHAVGESVPCLVEVIVALDRLRVATPGEVAAYLERRGRFPGIRTLRTALGQVSRELAHSGKERLGRRLIREAGLRPHARPLAIVVGSMIIAEIDLAWPDVRYGVEIDGPHHLLPPVMRADKARDRRLGRLDWMIDRFTDEEIAQDPRGFVAQVRPGLAAAVARDVAPWR